VVVAHLSVEDAVISDAVIFDAVISDAVISDVISTAAELKCIMSIALYSL
jgi:hypothetical protein